MATNPLTKLAGFGQSVWLDFIRRRLIRSGGLADLIERDGLRGVTSNPSIFEKAIDGSRDYDDQIQALAAQGDSLEEIYTALTVADVQDAADAFRPLYDRLEGADGYVSLEVSPRLARDTEGTIAQAKDLWERLDRPNVLIKIPATREGLSAIQRCIADGVNVNVTLLFGLPRYRQVVEAYLSGLEERARRGDDLRGVMSVASFFLSRIDVEVDPRLDRIVSAQGPGAHRAERLRGRIAIASAKIARRVYEQLFESERFRELAEAGARPQRLLWASTSTKDPAYSDVKYVEALIGADTVNTLPMETLDAYRDHGDPAPRLADGRDEALQALSDLDDLGIDIDEVTHKLVAEGVDKFVAPFERLLDSLRKKRLASLPGAADSQSLALGAEDDAAVQDTLARLERDGFVERLWRRDPSLWSTDPEDRKSIRNGLGWLHVAEKMQAHLPELEAFAREVRRAGFERVVHMGMGGSSLTPLVLARTLDPGPGGLPVSVLDTTDPGTIQALEERIPLERTLFIVASKSGTTTEPIAFAKYFYAHLEERLGDGAGGHFVAITDPGTPLVDMAVEHGFRRTFLNYPDIGGRYSALSYFGLVPATLMGLPIAELLARARRMMHACTPAVPIRENPGVALGAALAHLASGGRDKVTFLMPGSISALGLWFEQLLAESTGKKGRGLVPVAAEPPGEPEAYGDDRLFIHLYCAADGDEGDLGPAVEALRGAGHPVITIRLEDRLDLAQEFFRWEVATATAGSLLKINAFDQPNVQESKDNASDLLDRARDAGGLPHGDPVLSEGGLRVYSELTAGDLEQLLARFLESASPGDYVALLAYLSETDEHQQALQSIRRRLRDALHLTTTLGYGPRYLHSTGQLHKGGPIKGLFLELTGGTDGGAQGKIPGEDFGFDTLKDAQDLGDFKALQRHDQRVVRIDLGRDVEHGLERLARAVDEATASEK